MYFRFYPKDSNLKYRAGFSLLELSASLFILGIMILVMIPSFSSTDPKKLELAAEIVAQALRYARSEAMRTGEIHGVLIDTNDSQALGRDITVFKADLGQSLPADQDVVAIPGTYTPTEMMAAHRAGALVAVALLPALLVGLAATLLVGVTTTIPADAAATDVTDFGNRVSMGQLERYVLQRVGFKYAGAGRMVYPGLQQLSSFMAMNAEKHAKAFTNQILRVAKGEVRKLPLKVSDIYRRLTT